MTLVLARPQVVPAPSTCGKRETRTSQLQDTSVPASGGLWLVWSPQTAPIPVLSGIAILTWVGPEASPSWLGHLDPRPETAQQMVLSLGTKGSDGDPGRGCWPDPWMDGVGPAGRKQLGAQAWVRATPHSPTLSQSNVWGPEPSAPKGDMAQEPPPGQACHPTLPTKMALALQFGSEFHCRWARVGDRGLRP